MKKFMFIFLGAIMLLVLLVVLADAAEPKKPDFFPYYSTQVKKPLGLNVLDKEAEKLFSGSKVHRVRYVLSELADSLYDYNSRKYKISGTVMRISADGIDNDWRSEESILTFAASGNTVFLAVPSLSESLCDSLEIKMNTFPLQGKSVELYTAEAPSKKYKFDKGADYTYLEFNEENKAIEVLGYQKLGNAVTPNFISIPYGYGHVVINTQPAAFTNYYLLKDDYYKYAEAVASQIPVGDIYWQIATGHKENRGLLDYFLSKPAFRAFWWLGWIALILFIFFNARRRQRIVPIVPPVINTTVDFARTIGNLYYQEGDHNTIIDKKIIYFLENIRRDFFIDTYELDDIFVEKLHAKTGKPKDDILTVIALIKNHRQNLSSSEADVIAINNAIEKLRL